MRRRTYVAMVGSAALAGCVGQSGEEDGEETDATETDESESVELRKLWEADLEDESNVADYHATSDAETAYLGTPSHLTALSLADGTEQWTLSLDEIFNGETGVALNGVTADDDGVFTLQDRTVQRVDPATGESRWASTAEGITSGVQNSFMATTDEHVAAGGADGVIVFEKESGRLTAQLTDAGWDPVRAWNGQFVVIEASGVTAYDPDGTAQSTVEDVSVSWLTPVAGSTVVGGSANGTFVGIDLDSGKQLWTTEVSGEFTYPTTAATDDTVFVYPDWNDADTFYALNADTGAVRWEEGDTESGVFPPVVLEPGIVFSDGDGVQANEHKSGTQIDSIGDHGSQDAATGSGRTVVMSDTTAVAYRL